jgi:glycosyltransferase involved in cell wall biosynthesis
MIDVIFDGTILSHYNKKTKGRSGIFRFVDSIFKEFHKNFLDDINLLLYTSGMVENDILSYLSIHEIYLNLFPTFIDNEYLAASERYRRIANKIDMCDSNMFLSVLQRASNHILKMNILKRKRNLNKSFHHNSICIFQSNTISIDKNFHSQKGVCYFQMIYDLIPLILPMPGTQASRQKIEALLKGLSKDDHIFCISEYTKNDLLNNSKFINREKCIVIPLAASELFYQCSDLKMKEEIRKKYNIPLTGYYILTLCNLEPRKNLEGLLRSFFDLVNSREVKDLYLVLAGSKGWDYENIFHTLNIAESEEVKKKVIFPGYIDDQDLSPLYSGALSFVFPSFYEGFGLPPLEAMQCGTPVIASNTTSIPEVVGDAGILIDPYKQDELSEAILKLYKNQTLRQDLSRKGMERAKLFSWEKTAAKMIDAYKSALIK